jgi:hypothetical protein
VNYDIGSDDPGNDDDRDGNVGETNMPLHLAKETETKYHYEGRIAGIRTSGSLDKSARNGDHSDSGLPHAASIESVENRVLLYL